MKFNGIGSGTRMTVNQWVSGNIPKQPYVEGMDKYIQDGSPIVMVGLNSGVMTAKQYLYDDVRDTKQDFAELFLRLLQLAVQRGNLIADLAHFLYQRVGVLAVLLHHADFLRRRVALPLQSFDLAEDFPAALLQIGKEES